MARSSRGSVVSMILIASIVYSYWQYAHYVPLLFLLVIAIKLAIKGFRIGRSVVGNHSLKYIDSMDGLAFEQFIANMLRDQGFTGVQLTERYDLGVDIVAEKNGQRWGIQVKRYSGLVKAAAVRQVVTALKFYKCERSMVITNSTYSQVARQLAESNECVLIGRSELQRMIG